MTLEELGYFVQRERREQKISQQELATRARISIATLCRLERRENVSFSIASAVLNQLGYELKVVGKE